MAVNSRILKLVSEMKQKLLIFILLSCPFNATFAVKKDPSLLNKIINTVSFPIAPSEVSHNFDIIRSADQPYMLDVDRIAELQKMYEQNFKVRANLAKATYAVTAGSLVWLGYKWGIFDWILPKAASSDASPLNALPEVVDSSKTAEHLKTLIDFSKNMHERLEALDAKKEVQTGHWLINGIKHVGWSGASIAGSLILQSKWYSFFGYALAEPSFKWFLSNHSIISTVDRLKRSVQALSSPNMPVEFANEYHIKALVPALESIIRNTEQFIAFIDFYLPLLEDDVVRKEAMNDISRYLFNITNDFLQKINPVLKDPRNQSALVPIIDEYRADIATFINRCKVFEEEFFPGA